jgi:hypothetical protein
VPCARGLPLVLSAPVMKTSPLQALKARFGDKQKLVDAVKALATDELWLDRVNAAKGLESVSNAKLLRLHETLSLVKKDFGSRTKLIESILKLSKREKDAGWKGRLEKASTPELVDLQTTAARKSKNVERLVKAAPAKAKTAPAKKKTVRSKKAKAKAASGASKATKASKPSKTK